MPFAVVVDFADYKGPPFFTGDDKKTWVPIRPTKETWKTYGTIEGTTHYRLQFPLGLAWGWTYHKMQGTTVKGPLVLKLGDSDMSPGLTYVGFSRSGCVDRVCILNGCSLERLTTKIFSESVKIRLKEDERLQALHDATMTLYDSVG